MRTYAAPLVLVGSLAILGLATSTPRVPGAAPPNRAGIASSRAAEVTRIRAHFDSVLVELDDHDISGLTAAQRARRAALMTTLREYKDRGAFPKNYDFPGRLVPYFVDRKTGVRCAVAQLLESTGRTDIVERVAATNVNVRVPELAGDTAFTAWLDASGLTLAEATRIQPTYAEDRRRERNSYAQASTVAITASLLSAVWNGTRNGDGQHPFVSVIGIGVGAATVGLGALGELYSDGTIPIAWKFGNVTTGIASMIVSTRSLARRHPAGNAKPDAANEQRASGRIEATVAPTISIIGQKAAGVAVNLRF